MHRRQIKNIVAFQNQSANLIPQTNDNYTTNYPPILTNKRADKIIQKDKVASR